MNYFLLNHECYFIKGASRGAIYDFATNSIYSVGTELAQIIEQSEKGISLNQLVKSNNDKVKLIEALG